MANRVDIKVGYSIDRNGLTELQKILNDISVQAKTPGKEMNKGFQDAASTARQLSSILEKSFNKDLGTINVAKFNQELIKTHLDLATIKKDLENVSQGSTAFNILSSSVLSANAQIKTANKALDQMAVTLKNTIRYGISSSVFNNFANSFQKAYSYARDLNESLNNIRIVTDASASKMEQFAVNANEASKRLGASTLAYTDAALIYYQQGLSDEEARARAEVTLKAANVTGQSAQEVSELLTSVWNGYKVDAEEAELYVDKLAAVAATTAADLEELSVGMSKVASAANLMGVDVDQLNAQLATIVSVTRQAPESVGTALKTIYARMGDIESGLSDETTLGNYTQEMANMGINVLDMNGKLRDMGEVIEEIGNKWTDLSREQQIALSQTMAGTRQYNNLLALFDNWGMYTSAINTSREAVGTLQKQQDIYMQSTEAHLKRLQATWEDLYDSAIDDSEVNAGIDLLNNLIQTFDNFIDSFGGGVKSLAAFGAVLSNVFNKQISSAITNFIQNQTKMQQNIDLLEKKRQAIQLGASETGISGPAGEAELANTSTQLKYAQQIREVEIGISQEQYNQLTNLQAQMGELEKKAVLLEKESEANTKKVLGEEEYQKYLALELKDEEEIANYWQKGINSASEELEIRKNSLTYLEKQTKYTERFLLSEEELADVQEEINGLINRTSGELEKELKSATKNIDFNKATLKEKEKILDIVRRIVKEQENEVDVNRRNAQAIEEERRNKEEAARLRTQEGQLNVEFENTMNYAKQATDIAERVTMVTSTLSSMVSVWSGVNSLFQTWNDENATLGDKLTQTFMTLSMTIPTLVTAFKSLKGISDLYNLSKAKTIAMQEVETALRTKELAGLSEEAILQKAVSIVKQQGVAMTEAEVAARLQNIGLLKTESVAHGANATAKTVETGATTAATAAQNALNASMWAFPGTWIVAALAAVAGAIALVSNAVEEGRKRVRAANDETIQTEKSKQAEIAKNEELYKSYNDLYEQYQQGNATKDQMIDITNKLAEKLGLEKTNVVNLTGAYGDLNEEIQKYRRNQAQEALKSAQEVAESAKSNLHITAAKNRGNVVSARGIGLGTNPYQVELNTGWSASDESDMIKRLRQEFGSSFQHDVLSGAASSQGAYAINIADTPKDIINLYERLNRVIENVTDASTIQDSELYAGISEWLENMKDDVEAYKKAVEAVDEATVQAELQNMQFSKNSVEDFEKSRQKVIDYIKTVTEYKDLSLDMQSRIADDYILQIDGNASKMLQRVHILHELIKNFGEENKENILSALENISDEDLTYVLQVNENESMKSVEKFFENVEEKINEIHISDALKKELDGLKVSEDQFKEYVETLEELNEEDKKASSNAKEFQEQTKKVALNVIKTNNAVETLSKSFEENRKIIEDNNTSSYDYIKALGDVKEQLETILGVEVSNDFVTQNLNQIQALVDGNVDALDQLRIAAAQDIIQHLTIDLEDQSIVDAYNVINDFITNFDGSKITIDSALDDTEFVNALNYMLKEGQITAEEANKILSSIGYQPSIGTTIVPKSEVHHYVRTNDDTGETTRYTETDTFDLEVPVINADNTLYKGSGQNILSYSNNANKGKTPSSSKKSGGGGGSSKTKEPDKKDPVQEEINRYHDVDIQLTQISTDLKRLEDQKKKLFGKDLIDNLNKQLALLNKQIETTRQKIEIANGETKELQDKLSEKGVLFNEDGTIANYADVYVAQMAHVNAIIDEYNNMSAEAQEAAKDTVKDAEDEFKEFLKYIDRYDELVSKTLPGLEDDIQKAIDEQITMQIEKFDMEIEIRLDLAEAERDWNEFKKTIIDEVQDDDILGQAIGKLTDFSSYYKEDSTGIVQALTNQVKNTLNELDKMDKIGSSDVYGDNRTAALEDLQKYYTTLMENLTDVADLQKEIHEAYIDMQDEAQDKFDEQVETYEMIGDLIDHDMKVIQMVYGEDSYSTLAQYYNKQQENNNKQLDFQKQQVEFWRQQIDTLEQGSKEWENAKEKWMDAVKEWNNLVEQSIENLQDKYLNAINDIFDRLNDKVTNGLGLDYVNEQWNLINKNADQYLDSINALYETQALENKYLDAIDKTDSVGAQRQLKELMDAELADLRERDKLTQYDVERANKKYEIALKQIALQEAQQNKTRMRLRRDSQGNYRYEYTSDSDQVSQIQDELNSMYNSLYNFDKARYQENLGQIYDAWSEFQEKMAEAAQINDPQERAERELLLQDEYGKLINGLVEQNSQVRLNLQESAFEDLSRLYDKDIKEYQNMTEAETDALMNGLVPQWESGVQAMADAFAGEGGFIGVCRDALENLNDATKDYEESLDDLQDAANQDFDSISDGIDDTIDRTEDLLYQNEDLIESYEEEMDAIENVIDQLDDLVDKYNEAREAAIAATQAAYEYWSAQNRQAADSAKADVESSKNASGPSHSPQDTNKVGDTKSDLAGFGDGNLVVGESATFSGKYYYDSYGTAPVGSKYSGVANGVVIDRITDNPYGIHIHSADGRYMDLGWVKKSQLSGYDTGGYTGAWGNDGRLALLHQKELVLNAHDTENMLNAVTIMRDITSTLGGSILNRLAGIAAAGTNGTTSNGLLDQNVSIQATFPNVTSSREIEDALNNLVNMAAIRANRKGS